MRDGHRAGLMGSNENRADVSATLRSEPGAAERTGCDGVGGWEPGLQGGGRVQPERSQARVHLVSGKLRQGVLTLSSLLKYVCVFNFMVL